jgi:membrane protein DedA with SNARE-associated domain
MNLVQFYLWTLLGSGVFCSGLILLGYYAGGHLDVILPQLQRGGYIALAVAVVAVAVVFVVYRMRAKRGATLDQQTQGDTAASP